MSVALLLLPEFALILLGAVLFRVGRLGAEFWTGLEKLIYFVLFPALLLSATASAHFDFATTSRFVLVGSGSLVAGMVLGFFARFLAEDSLTFASGFQTAFRFNSYIGLAIGASLGGTDGVALAAILIGINVPLSNAAAVFALARHGNTNIAMALLQNPLILATVCGLTINFCGLQLPGPLFQTLTQLGNASIALGLLTVGAGLRLTGAHARWPASAWLVFVKLIACPAVALTLSMLMDLTPMQRHIVVAFAGLPTASSAYILAARMGGNGPLVAFLISLGTVLSALTLPVWITLAR